MRCQTEEDTSDLNLSLRITFQRCYQIIEFHALPTEFIGVDDKVIVIEHYYGESKVFKKFSVPFCHIHLIKQNKILQFKQFTGTEKIHEATRL
jgi:hypothetical protein